MSNERSKADETREALSSIIGERLLGSRNLCATRHFYFGRTTSQMEPGGRCFTIGLECPWRLRLTNSRIIVGSEDYYEKAVGNEDPNWEPGSPAGHLQDQLLTNLLGTYRDGDVINEGVGFVVQSIDADDSDGFSIAMTGGIALEALPTSVHVMEWIFMRPEGGSLVLMNGELHGTDTDSGHL
jgi:hypothetical protein